MNLGCALRPDVVIANLAIERGGVHSEELRGAGLMPAGYFKRSPDQLDLKAVNLVIKGYAS